MNFKKSKDIKEEMKRRVGYGEKPCDVAKDFGVTLAQPINEHELKPSFNRFLEELTDETIIKYKH